MSYVSFSYSPTKQQKHVYLLKNPVAGLSDEEASAQFNEDFVLYLLYTIKAQTLHNPPLSSNTPKIEIFVDDDTYNAEVKENVIAVKKNTIEKKDIVIRTTKHEAVKMLRDSRYIVESFKNGNARVDRIEDKPTLFAKGYLTIYTELTGEE